MRSGGSIAPDGTPDLVHVIGLGVIAGATRVLVELHPEPTRARCDGYQALEPRHLGYGLDYVARARKAYEELVELRPR